MKDRRRKIENLADNYGLSVEEEKTVEAIYDAPPLRKYSYPTKEEAEKDRIAKQYASRVSKTPFPQDE